MIAIFQFLWYGHIHKWKIIEKTDVVNMLTNGSWTRHYCQCEKCGTIKKFD